MPDQNLSHIILPVDQISAAPFVPKSGGTRNKPTRINRQEHADKLKQELEEIEVGHSNAGFFTIKFSGRPNMTLLCEDLDKKGFQMELLSVKESNGTTIANVRIDAAKTFEKLYKKLDEYREKDVESPLPYIASIENINEIKIQDLFTDDESLFPTDLRNRLWWEIWITNKVEESVSHFQQIAHENNVYFNERPIIFEDRTVFLVKASVVELENFIKKCSLIAEIRIAKELHQSILNYNTEDQEKLVTEIQEKIRDCTADNNIRIVVLDGNIIKRHPLITSFIVRNQQALTNFSLENNKEHATEMASLTLLGDIRKTVEKDDIFIHHTVEGVQIYDSVNNDKDLYGKITEEAVQKTQDNVHSAYIMPVTEEYSEHYHGKPSSWSASIDKVIFQNKKLFSISVGNISNICLEDDYDEMQKKSCIESPAQSWNALSIGSYTDYCNSDLCRFEGAVPYTLLSKDISPYSRTSCLFSSAWPIKPEVLFEGGNKVVHNDHNVYQHDALEPVACSGNFKEQAFTNINATSASTGLSGNFIGELMATYPLFWPETIRGLIIHSAEWSETMKNKLPSNYNKSDINKLSHIFGYGIPNLQKAKYSALSALTIIAQKDNFQVFVPKNGSLSPKEKEKSSSILFVKLPWPKELLTNELGQRKIKLTITLSYYIEPNPSERGYSNKYAYQSHNLRFDLQRPTETLEQFRSRINKLIAVEETEGVTSSDSYDWLFGPNSRTHGSVHKDVLEISGVDLAAAEYVAVYSVTGWWKSRKTKLANDTFSRFSLIISIDAGETEVDLYNEIKNNIEIPISLESRL